MTPAQESPRSTSRPAASARRRPPALTPRQTALCDRWAAALLLLLAGLLLHGAWSVGPTYDEHFYIASGYAYWESGDFALNREHPPLLKLLFALPLLPLGDVVFPAAWDRMVDYPAAFFYRLNAEHLDRNLFLARLPACLLTLLVAWAVYRLGKRYFGARAGLVALMLLAFNPNVLGHGRLAALDMGAAALLFPAAMAFVALLERPSARAGLVAALLFGLANLAKFTALLLLPLFGLLAIGAAARARSWRPLAWLLVTAFGGLGVFAAGYGFEAVSRNEAWSRAPYVDDVDPIPQADPTPGELAEQLVAAHPESDPLGPARYQRVARAADLESALALLVDYAQSDAAVLAQAASAVLRDLAHSSQFARKLAFGELIERAAAVPQAGGELLELCRVLAQRELDDVAAARAWWAQSRGENWNTRLFAQSWLDRGLARLFGGSRPIPLFSALRGIDYQLAHGGGGHLSYFDGRVLGPEAFADGTPHPEYYSVLMGAKNPPLFLALVAAGLVLAFFPSRGWTLLRAAALLGFPVLGMLVFSKGSLLLGVKYLLPIFPFLALLAARAAIWAPRLALVLAALCAVEGVLLQPHQLMYYNLFVGGPSGGPQLSIVGDDWGQGVRDVGRYYAEHREAIDRTGGLYYEPYSKADPACFGLQDAHPVYAPLQGIVAVHAVDYYRRPERFGWLADYEPFARLGWSVWLYDTRTAAPGGAGIGP